MMLGRGGARHLLPCLFSLTPSSRLYQTSHVSPGSTAWRSFFCSWRTAPQLRASTAALGGYRRGSPCLAKGGGGGGKLSEVRQERRRG